MRCLFGHKWDGCKCTKCGDVRDEEHDWDGCKCKRCDKVRDREHSFQAVEGKCKEKRTVCGKDTSCGT